MTTNLTPSFLRGPKFPSGQIALGVGIYGHPVLCPLDTFKLPCCVIGGMRTGKTRLANSINSQQVRTTGGGAVILDYKGGLDIPAYWAEVAQQEHRAFHHFTLNEKSGGAYHRPHPYARAEPSFYDPLVRGNGDSKTSMLLNSVDRDGDAAAYLRTAEDVVMLAFDIADLTGLSAGKGGLETLSQVLDIAELDKAANKLTIDAVLRAHPSMSEVDARRRVTMLQHRVSEMNQKTQRGSVLAGAISDSQTTISKFANSSALGGRLRPGRDNTDTIDLVRAVLQGEIIVFSLPSNDYRSLSILVSTMVLLDLQNATSTLRKNIIDVRRLTGDTSQKADATPWKPFIVQVEELGSAKSMAAANALLGLLNKSSNEGIRVTLSSQGWGDFIAVDGTGVWANQVLQLVYNMFAFQLGSEADDETVCGFSGQVDKIKPRIKHEIDVGGRWRLRSGARALNAGMTDSVRETRIPAGTLQELVKDDETDTREFVWTAKSPTLRTTHTVPEGPNMWFERLRLVTVKEPPISHDFFAVAADVEKAETQRDEVLEHLEQRVRSDKVLAHVLSSDAAATGVPDYADGELQLPATVTSAAVTLPSEGIVVPAAADPWAPAATQAPSRVECPASGSRDLAEDIPLPPDPGPGPWDRDSVTDAGADAGTATAATEDWDDWSSPWDNATQPETANSQPARVEKATSSIAERGNLPPTPNVSAPLDATDL